MSTNQPAADQPSDQPQPAQPRQPEQPRPEEKREQPEQPVENVPALKDKLDEYLNGWKRAKADYLNLKKETEKREREIIQFATAGILLEVIPVYDNFKLAWKHIPDDRKADEWVKGIEHIKNQLAKLIKDAGIEEIPTEGKMFDPNLHEAVAREKAEGKESGTILEEVKGGYKLHDKVLEHAKVKVAE